VVAGRRKEELERVVGNITKKGGKAEGNRTRRQQKSDVNKAATRSCPRHGRIDLPGQQPGINGERSCDMNWRAGTSS